MCCTAALTMASGAEGRWQTQNHRQDIAVSNDNGAEMYDAEACETYDGSSLFFSALIDNEMVDNADMKWCVTSQRRSFNHSLIPYSTVTQQRPPPRTSPSSPPPGCLPWEAGWP